MTIRYILIINAINQKYSESIIDHVTAKWLSLIVCEDKCNVNMKLSMRTENNLNASFCKYMHGTNGYLLITGQSLHEEGNIKFP